MEILLIKKLCCVGPFTLSIAHLVLQLGGKKRKKNQMLVKFKNCESCAPLTEINWLKFSFLPPCQFWPALSSYRAVVNLGSGERPNRLLGAFSTDVDMRSGTPRQRQSWTAVPSRWLVLAVVKAPDCAVLGQFL